MPITETDTVGVVFGIDRNQITVIPGATPDPFIDYVDALGRRTFNAWRTEISWARDSRNAFFNPTRGTFQRVSAELTLPGSTVEYYKLNYQFAKYYSISEHLIIPEILVFSRATWDKMSKDDQALLKKLSKEAQAECRMLWAEKEKASMAELQKAGIEIIKFSPEEKKKMQAAVKPVWDKYGSKYTQLVQRIQDIK